MPVQSAKILSELSSEEAGERIGAVLKPCEYRAAVELTKFRQVNLEQFVTIGVDCEGTYEVSAFAEHARQAESRDRTGLPYRTSCGICTTPVPENTDISLCFFG